MFITFNNQVFITSREAERNTLQLAGEEFALNDVCKNSVENTDIFSLAAGFCFWLDAKQRHGKGI